MISSPMGKPTIALCIPAFKAENHLPRLLESARQQDPPFDEIIVCVDASPDSSAEIARSFGATVLVNQTNLGCSASKNKALQAATADWIHFHDADDILLPGFTQEALSWGGQQSPPEVVIMGYDYVDFKTQKYLASGLQSDEHLSSDPLGYAIRNKLPNCGLYQREKILSLGGFHVDPSILYNEDVAFHIKLALAGCSFRASARITSIIYRHGDSMSSGSAVKCELAHIEVMRRVAEETGGRFSKDIAARLWASATVLACHQIWSDVDNALTLAKRLYPGVPLGQSKSFYFLCNMIGPSAAFRVREHAIRRFKPHLRASQTASAFLS